MSKPFLPSEKAPTILVTTQTKVTENTLRPIDKLKLHLEKGTEEESCSLGEPSQCLETHIKNPATCKCITKESSLGKLIVRDRQLRQNKARKLNELPFYADDKVLRKIELTEKETKNLGNQLDKVSQHLNDMQKDKQRVDELEKHILRQNYSAEESLHQLKVQKEKLDEHDSKLQDVVKNLAQHGNTTEQLKVEIELQKSFEKERSQMLENQKLQQEEHDAKVAAMVKISSEQSEMNFQMKSWMDEITKTREEILKDAKEFKSIYEFVTAALSECRIAAKNCNEVKVELLSSFHGFETKMLGLETDQKNILSQLGDKMYEKMKEHELSMERREFESIEKMETRVKIFSEEILAKTKAAIIAQSEGTQEGVRKMINDEMIKMNILTENTAKFVHNAEESSKRAAMQAELAVKVSNEAAKKTDEKFENVRNNTNHAIQQVNKDLELFKTRAEEAVTKVEEEVDHIRSQLKIEAVELENIVTNTITEMSSEEIKKQEKREINVLPMQEINRHHHQNNIITANKEEEDEQEQEQEKEQEQEQEQEQEEEEELQGHMIPPEIEESGMGELEEDIIAQNAQREVMEQKAKLNEHEHIVEEEKAKFKAEHEIAVKTYNEALELEKQMIKEQKEAAHQEGIVGQTQKLVKRLEEEAEKHPSDQRTIANLLAAEDALKAANDSAQMALQEAQQIQAEFERLAAANNNQEEILKDHKKTIEENERNLEISKREIERATGILREEEATAKYAHEQQLKLGKEKSLSHFENVMNQTHGKIINGEWIRPKTEIEKYLQDTPYQNLLHKTPTRPVSFNNYMGNFSSKSIEPIRPALNRYGGMYQGGFQPANSSSTFTPYKFRSLGGGETEKYNNDQQAEITELALRDLLFIGLSPTDKEFKNVMAFVRKQASTGVKIVMNPNHEDHEKVIKFALDKHRGEYENKK